MTKLSRRMVVLITSLVLLGTGMPAMSAPPDGGGPGAGQVFESLEQAAEYGAVDPVLVKLLRAGKKVTIIAQLDPGKVIDAYGIGDEAGVAKAAELVAAMRTSVLKEVPVKPLDIFQLVPQFVTELSDAELALRLINSKLVASLIPDRANNLHLDESLTLIGQRPLAVGGGLNGSGTSVVVLDTGADFTDVEFGMCTAPGVPAGCRVPVAFDAAPDDSSMDDHGHGTNVSAVVAGVAPGAMVIPIDVYSGPYIRDRHAISALNWVLANRYRYNIAAVNMSFGFDNYFTTVCGGTSFLNAYTSPFQMMRQAGTLPVASAGNHASQTGSTFKNGVAAPACTDGAIAVGASYTHDEAADKPWVGCTDKAPIITDQLACFSAGGPMVDVIAPGTDIKAAGITMNGTSQASPHVAAAVAMLAQAAPLSTAFQRETALKTSGTQLFDSRTGLLHPRLDLPAAVRAAAPVPNDDLAHPTVLSGPSGRTTQTTWTATIQLGEPLHGGDLGGASIWYEWTPAFAINAVFSTAGSDFDTLLGVYQLDVRGAPVLVAGNDDESVGITTSEVSVSVTPGQKLLIAVDGKFNPAEHFPATGRARLTWNLSNDNIADAIPFPGTINAIGVARSGSNLRSTHEFGEPAHCGDVYADASVWYRWTPSTDQAVRVRLGGSQQMCLAVYSAPRSMTAPPFSQLVLEFSLADDQGTPIDHDFTGLSTQTYWIAVDGVSNEVACNPYGLCDYETSAGPFGLQFN